MHEFSKWLNIMYEIGEEPTGDAVIAMACKLYRKETGKEICTVRHMHMVHYKDGAKRFAVDVDVSAFENWLLTEFELLNKENL